MSDKQELNYRLQRFKVEQRRKKEEFEPRTVVKLLILILRPATTQDYKEWLERFMTNGGTPTHYYDYHMRRVLYKWFVALADFELLPLYGSSSINIIVPAGIQFLGGKLGHSQLYFMDGPNSPNVGGIIPVYDNITF